MGCEDFYTETGVSLDSHSALRACLWVQSSPLGVDIAQQLHVLRRLGH